MSNKYSGKSGIYACTYPVYGVRKLVELLSAALPEDFKLNRDDLHVTLMYSKHCQPDQVTARHTLDAGDAQCVALPSKVVQWPGHDSKGYLVLLLASEDLEVRHRRWLATGAMHSFPKYEPHITLAKDYGTLLSPQVLLNVNHAIRENNLRLVFSGEHYEDIR